ncbi:DMT family transporter [Rhodospira trueperi]|uniref:Threonine/homoserine efflux transporter RhtA n=1 Tax=Rhodospira trueperi TaxID=69960 RepID=A0A1G7CGX4_9PROT|nr:DMT family transporter [Rhodospira trueperi]SDE38549.1 Threonine/homoserine efflux transporter RhtA [Rhodospira trueperi]
MANAGGADRRGPLARVADWPYLLLLLTVIFWSANSIVGRAASGHVPPIGLAFWRWTAAGLIMLVFAWPRLRREWPVVLAHWRILALLGFLGVSTFNTLLYIGLQYTQAVNALLIQTAMPILIILWTFFLFGERVTARQGLGVLISMAGAAVVITRGDPSLLLALDLNVGDAWTLAAVTCYAGYTALLRLKPALSARVFLAVTFLAGTTLLLPAYLWELLAQGRVMPLDLGTVAAVGYVALFASIAAFACFNRGVALVGATVAGQFLYLMPLIGGLMAVVFLGERLLWAHGAGLVLILAGLWLAARRPPARDRVRAKVRD